MGAYYWPYYYGGHFLQPQPEVKPIMSIPWIVSEILSYSSVTDLKLKRLVCKQWNYEACKVLRPKLRIKFNDYRRTLSYVVTMHCHKNFSDTFCLGPDIRLQAPVVNQFLVNFGHYIRSIDIRCAQIKITALRYILYELLPNLEELTINTNTNTICDFHMTELLQSNIQHLPRLKKLCLIGGNQCGGSSLNGTTDINMKTAISPYPLLKEILMAALNIQEISCMKSSDWDIDDDAYYKNLNAENFDENRNNYLSPNSYVWSTLVDVNNWEIIFPNLRSVNINVKVSDQCVQMLATKGFPLTTLDLNLQPNVTNKSLQFLLASLKDTLVHIKLKWQYSEKPEMKVELPVFEPFFFVKSIDLTNYRGSLSFVEYCPYLIKLILRRITLNNVVLKDLGYYPHYQQAHWSLQTLQVFEDYSNNDGSNHGKRSVQTVQKLGQLFPSIRRLRLEKLVDESLLLIYAQWPNIEELEISGGFTDSGTTGIHPNAYRVILREEAYDLFNIDALRQGLFIGNLTKLKKLHIHSPKITDVSIILGVLRCPSIRFLSIQSYWITDTAIYRLSTNRRLLDLKTEYCNQLSTEAICFATKKLQENGCNASLNKYNGPLNVIQIKKFLRMCPKAQVCLNRLNNVNKLKPIRDKKINSSKKSKFMVSVPELNLKTKAGRKPRSCRSMFKKLA